MKYGFIGCGNMGGAIAKALAQATHDIVLSDRSGKAKALAEKLGCIYADPLTVASHCDCIFLAVKPQTMESVLTPLQSIFCERRPLLITMAAGLTIDRIMEMSGTPLPVIRIMPNTPVSVGKGMIPYCCNDLVTKERLAEVLLDLRFAGALDMLEETLIDAATALSGSGPAYMYLFLEALTDGAVACGLPKEKALKYAIMTMTGAAQMALDTGEDPAALREAVCSPGGSTIVGINALENHDFRDAVMDCVQAAYKKNIDLGK